MSHLLNFNNTYVKLPEAFYQATMPESVSKPHLEKFNLALASELGIHVDAQDSEEMAAIFSGGQLLKGSEPIAQAYAGHQFGGLSPQLGDGRALLLGELINPQGKRFDIQLKGSGRTAFSRGGDGKATLYSVLREYLMAEAMHALSIPTTRSLAVVASGESIIRDGVPVPSAILTRVASSHIRVGTFQYFAIRGENELVKQLADYTIKRHYPEAEDTDNPYLALLENVIDHQIHLITQWIRVGFIHGVMNTDNMTVSGETIDYGPCAFLDTYSPEAKFSSIDRRGRYAFGNQSAIGYWNLARFAETLVGLIHKDSDKSVELLTEVLQTYPEKMEQSLLRMHRQKLGLMEARTEDEDLIKEFLDILKQDDIDYTLAFRALTDDVHINSQESENDRDSFVRLIKSHERYSNWKRQWLNRIDQDYSGSMPRAKIMSQVNPIYIPRNWHVEQALITAADNNDYTLFDELYEVLQQPYTKQQGREKYANTPSPSTSAYKTYCGT